jgi:hypothetical protein
MYKMQCNLYGHVKKTVLHKLMLVQEPWNKELEIYFSLAKCGYIVYPVKVSLLTLSVALDIVL